MTSNGKAHAAADLREGTVVATVHVSAPPDRVFGALQSEAITKWWVRPGVFDTRTWEADVRVGGHWSATGIGNGKPYIMEGEFVEIDAPRKLAHTWNAAGSPAAPTRVSYTLEPAEGGTRVTLRHEGFTNPDTCAATGIGWETSLQRLAELLR